MKLIRGSFQVHKRQPPGDGKTEQLSSFITRLAFRSRPCQGKLPEHHQGPSVPSYLTCGSSSFRDQVDSQRTSSESHFEETLSPETTKGLTLKKLHQGRFNAAAGNWQPMPGLAYAPLGKGHRSLQGAKALRKSSSATPTGF